MQFFGKMRGAASFVADAPIADRNVFKVGKIMVEPTGIAAVTDVDVPDRRVIIIQIVHSAGAAFEFFLQRRAQFQIKRQVPAGFLVDGVKKIFSHLHRESSHFIRKEFYINRFGNLKRINLSFHSPNVG